MVKFSEKRIDKERKIEREEYIRVRCDPYHVFFFNLYFFLSEDSLDAWRWIIKARFYLYRFRFEIIIFYGEFDYLNVGKNVEQCLFDF